jgi:copper transport protein
MALAPLLLPAAAGAHTHLAGLRPEPEVVLQHAPQTVRLTFNQPVDVVARGTGISNDRRDAHAAVLRRAGGRQLLLRPRLLLRAGRVDVRFRVLSKDGHVLRGRYGFTVRRDAAPRGGALEVSAGAGGTTTSAAIAHGVHHLLFILALGLALVGPLVLSAAGLAVPVGALRAICVAGAVASLLCASLTWLAADSEPVTRALLPATIGDAAGTDAGAGWLLRGGLWLLAAAAAPSLLICGGALAAIALSLALSGHAGTHGGAGSVATDTVHVLAAGVWLGGLAVLVLALRRGADRAATTAAFARVALLAFAVLVVSGALNAVLRLGSVDALVDGAYGRLVLAKLAVAAVIAVVAVTGRRSVELLLGATALTLASILVETAPPT